VSRLKDGPTLVIAEKPSTAKSIAKALAAVSGNAPRAVKGKGLIYYELIVNGRLHIVSPAVGHLYGIHQKGSGWSYPVFDVEWRPSWEIDKSSQFTRPYLENFIFLGRQCTSFISATDYDREGSVIAYNILKFACGTDKAKRMKFSTLTTPDLVRSYNDAGELDYGQIQAGLARHTIDWYWGINITRALTLAMKPHSRGFGILSSGRVQGPTLKLLADRELEISSFVPEKFWTILLFCRHEGLEFVARSDPERIWDEARAEEIYQKCLGQPAYVTHAETGVATLYPPPPFDLTTLQTEAYRHFGFTPARTMNIAQTLYEEALISYPRTSSQKLPPTIDYERIVSQISNQGRYSALCGRLLAEGRLKPRQGAKSDPDHPAIYPTGARPGRLRIDQDKLYDLICRRFLACFARPARRESRDVVLTAAGFPFRASGRRTLEANWIEFYGPYAKFEDVILPHLEEGEEVEVLDVRKDEKETEPPGRYSQASIIKEMERRSLGTKATRALIVQTLYDRGYVRGRSIEVTELGMSVVDALSRYCPGVLSESLTAKLEKEMEAIEEGKAPMENLVEEARCSLTEILRKFKEKEEAIGRELAEASLQARAKANEIGPCPKCGGTLKFITSRRTGKRFIGCSGYSKGCSFSAPVPQSGRLTVTQAKCKGCGQPLISVQRAGKRPWRFCFNLECPLRNATKGNRSE